MRPVSDSHGFTLIELLTVIVLIAVVASFAVPRFEGMTARAEGRGALDQLTADIYYARVLAVREGARTELRFDRRPGDPACHLPEYEVVVRSTPERTAKRTRLEVRSGACLKLGAVDSITFNTRGLPVSSQPNRRVVIRKGDVADSITLSRLGRVIRWY